MLPWIILVIILVLICLLLRLKVGARVVFGDELKAWVKLGPLMLQVYPLVEKKKEKPKKEEKEKKESAEKKEKTARNITFDAVWQLIHELIPPILDTLERVRKGLHIDRLELHLMISDLNPAVAAQRYGKMNAVIWPLLAAVENVITVEQWNVQLDLDFASHKTKVDGELILTMRLHHGVRILLVDGMKILKPVLKFMKMTKATQDTKTTDTIEMKDTAAA